MQLIYYKRDVVDYCPEKNFSRYSMFESAKAIAMETY